MAYFNFFCENIENNRMKDDETIPGKCYDMCPKEEVAMREKEKLVHVLEVIGSKRQLVKSYSRSAADSNMAIPHLLRPYSVLKDTINYLLLNVTKREDVPTQIIYDFVNDRLRAVRQDMTIQRLAPEECVTLLEPMIRFHVFYGYQLSELPLNEYNPTLNKKYLLECIKWCLSCFDTIDKSSGGDIDDLTQSMSQMGMGNRSYLKCDRNLIESLYILCNLDDVHPLLRFLNLRKELKCNTTLQLAYKIAIANIKGNYVRVFKLMQTLCPLSYCALFLSLPVIQRKSLLVMSYAYNSKQLTVPSSVVRRWLCFSSDSETVDICRYYGLKTNNGDVKFVKADFNIDAVLHQPKKHFLHISKDTAFTFTTHR